MTEWWREAAWMVVGGTGYVNPRTKVEREGDGYRLTAHKVPGLSVWVAADSPLGRAVPTWNPMSQSFG